MRLVEFKLNKKKNVFINPELVLSVTAYGDNRTIIQSAQQVRVVEENVQDVVRKLTEKEF